MFPAWDVHSKTYRLNQQSVEFCLINVKLLPPATLWPDHGVSTLTDHCMYLIYSIYSELSMLSPCSKLYVKYILGTVHCLCSTKGCDCLLYFVFFDHPDRWIRRVVCCILSSLIIQIDGFDVYSKYSLIHEQAQRVLWEMLQDQQISAFFSASQQHMYTCTHARARAHTHTHTHTHTHARALCMHFIVFKNYM